MEEEKKTKKVWIKILLIVVGFIIADVVFRFVVFNFIDGQDIYFTDGTRIIYNRYFPWNKERYEQFKKYMFYNRPNNRDGLVAFKPIIYLYPEEEQEISVKLKYNDAITVSYPKYTNGWKVLAKENGTLTDIATNRKLYSLYYECQNTYNFQIEKDGFIVKGEEVAEFLEEKLAILGLTEREAEEFIIYWLPKLEANSYNYIRFATIDEIDANMPLEINPNPDTVIRVLMTFKGLDKPIEIQEQQLTSPERCGFVAVEWGGTEIK